MYRSLSSATHLVQRVVLWHVAWGQQGLDFRGKPGFGLRVVSAGKDNVLEMTFFLTETFVHSVVHEKFILSIYAE